jgi:hypothetical protein
MVQQVTEPFSATKWRELAAQSREAARPMQDIEATRTMLRIAAGFDALPTQSELPERPIDSLLWWASRLSDPPVMPDKVGLSGGAAAVTHFEISAAGVAVTPNKAPRMSCGNAS